MKYPSEYGTFSLYIITILIISTFTIVKYGFKFYGSAYKIWKFSRSFNMETLITIGSLTAYGFGIYLLIMGALRHSVEGFNN